MKLKIGNFKLSNNSRPIFVAEISGNHGGKLSNALKLVRKASQNGADFIKLQTYQADNLTLNSAKPGFIIKDKKSIWKKKNFLIYIKKEKQKKNGTTKYLTRQRNIKLGVLLLYSMKMILSF